MRDGVLLAQSSPTALLKTYNTTVSRYNRRTVVVNYIVKQYSYSYSYSYIV